MEHCKNQFEFDQEIAALATDIFSETLEYNPDADRDALEPLLDERCWETADGHQWTIYTYQAMQLCANVNTDDGEEWLEEVHGKPFDECNSYSDVVTRLTFATIHTALHEALMGLLTD